MGWARLDPPGQEYGPCKKPCEHRDCAATRAMANTICPLCESLIGYDRRYYREADGLAHAACVEDAHANRRS